jgi:hypothetical protein
VRIAVAKPAEVLLLQLLRTGELDRRGPELVDGRDQRRRHVGAGHLLDDQAGGEGVRPCTAVLLRDVRGVEVSRTQRIAWCSSDRAYIGKVSLTNES